MAIISAVQCVASPVGSPRVSATVRSRTLADSGGMRDIEADAEDGFSDADIGVVRDNARQLKFKPESTGFE